MERTATLKPVTPMQLVVATLLGVGQTHAQVAAYLKIAVGTVRDHLNTLARRIPGDLPAEAKVVAWVRGATIDVLEGRTLRYEVMVEGERARSRWGEIARVDQ